MVEFGKVIRREELSVHGKFRNLSCCWVLVSRNIWLMYVKNMMWRGSPFSFYPSVVAALLLACICL